MACPPLKGIVFLRKNFIDLDKPDVTITITDSVATNTGQGSVDLLRNRNNYSGWATTGSNDSANTEILVGLGDIYNITDIMLIKHSFKDYLIEYKDPDDDLFYTYENVTSDTKDTSIYTKAAAVYSREIKVTIYNTKTVDADKLMTQLIITQKFFNGQLESFPKINKPTHSKNKRINKMLSGKVHLVEQRGFFSCELDVKLKEENDLETIENMHENREGVLMLISGYNEDQFLSKRLGYRDEDIKLVRPINEFMNPYDQGIYLNRQKLKIKLAEVVF